MKIKEIVFQSGRDLTAIYECEHCGKTIKGYGYDDNNFHMNVIPKTKCSFCGKVTVSPFCTCDNCREVGK